MAQQESFIKLIGKIGDLTFFKTKTGYQAREKGGVSADRIANDPAYLRKRENNAMFIALYCGDMLGQSECLAMAVIFAGV